VPASTPISGGGSGSSARSGDSAGARAGSLPQPDAGRGVSGRAASPSAGVPQNQKAAPTITYTAKVSLDSGTHFSIKIGAHDQVSQAFRGVAGAAHDKARGCWLLPMSQYEAGERALNKLVGVKVNWEGLPNVVFKILKAMGAACNDADKKYELLCTAPPGGGESLDTRMMAFQREGVQFALRRGGRVLIGDEMGLGKTVQGCALLKCYEDEWPALIVTPSSLRGQWADALKHWLHLTDRDIVVIWSGKDVEQVGKAKITIMSYNMVGTMKDSLGRRKPFQVVRARACVHA
jgi:SWI/SNF-related matrix-associated actin-dependent regulator 1 of chromatin subfamily A